MKEDNSWKIDSKSKIKYCDSCGEEIKGDDGIDYFSYKSGPPYYDTIYICKSCHNGKEEKDG